MNFVMSVFKISASVEFCIIKIQKKVTEKRKNPLASFCNTLFYLSYVQRLLNDRGWQRGRRAKVYNPRKFVEKLYEKL